MRRYNKVCILEQLKEKEIPKYGCQICKYIVLSPKNNCHHKLCDYCLTGRYSSKLAECLICEVIQRQHNGSFRQT